MKVLEYVQVRTCFSRAPQRLRNALDKIAALLCWRQFRWLRNIREHSSKPWSYLHEFGRIFSHPSTEIIETRRLCQIAFNDLREGKIGEGFVSFVAVSDEASEADARRAVCHLHRQAGLAHAGSAPKHDQRVEPLEDAAVAPSSWGFAGRRPYSDAFKRFAFGLQISLGIVVGSVSADVSEPASDHRDVNAGGDQMYGSRVPEAVRRDVLRRQARHLLGRRRDVMRELKAHARGAKWSTIAVDEESFVVSSRLPYQ